MKKESANIRPVSPKVFTFDSTGGDKEGYPILIKRHVDQKDTDVHEHVFYEIVYIESGTAEQVSAEGTRRLIVGDVLVIKPRVWHSYRHAKNFGIINCLFDRRILIHQKVFLSLASGAFELFQRPVRDPSSTPPVGLHATPTQREHVLRILEAMMFERQEKQPDWQGALVALLLNLIVAISRMHYRSEGGDPLSEQSRDLANKLVVYLEEQFRERITLAALSKRFHTSPSYLSRIFTKRMGMGVIDYINHLRVETACDLLRKTDLSATEIASEVGYGEIPYFYRRFRREIGRSPLEYREYARRGRDHGLNNSGTAS